MKGRPTRVLGWIGLFLLAVALAGTLLFEPLRAAFLANPVFNGMILAVLAVGLAINVRQVMVLGPEERWLRSFRQSNLETPALPVGSILGSLGRLLSERADERKLRFSTATMQALLDGIRSRLDESRDLSRYIIGLLIFLGLLGTFWGLLDTLSAVGGVIGGLTVGAEADVSAVFQQLRSGLEQPLAGMGTAFSSSLFGLAGALVLGFVDLQAGHAQNRFYNDLDEWLAGQTHFTTGHGAQLADGETPIPAYIQALLEQTAEGLDKLQRTLSRSDDERRASEQSLRALTEQVASLAEQARNEQKLVMTLSRNQMELQPLLARLADVLGEREQHDGQVREHLRSLDRGMGRLLEDLGSHRREAVAELRDELRLLSRTVARLPGDGQS